MPLAPAWDRRGRPPLTYRQRGVRLAILVALLSVLLLLGYKIVKIGIEISSFTSNGWP